MALQLRPSDFDEAELDKNDTNSAAPTTARQDDGYVTSAEPPSNEHNFIFARLWRGIKALFQIPIAEFQTTTFYEAKEWAREAGIVFEAKVAFTSTGSFDVNDWDVAIKSGVESVNSDSGPDVVLDASDFSDINSITQNDLRYLRPVNGLINSDFELWTEGTVFSPAVPGQYFADIYRYGNTTSAVHTIQRVTDAPTFAESSVNSRFSPEIKVDTTSGTPPADQFTELQAHIEGFGIRDILGRTITISFWVKSSITGIFCVALRNRSIARSFVHEYTISAANTWEPKEFTLLFDSTGTWDIDQNLGLILSWTLAAGSDFQTSPDSFVAGNKISTVNQVNFNDVINSTFQITLPQIDIGSTRRTFNKLSINKDFIDIKRFLQIYLNMRYVSQKDGQPFPFEWAVLYPEIMRIIPTVTSSNVFFENADTLTFNNISPSNLNVGILSSGGIVSQTMAVEFDLKLDARF